MGLPGLAQRRAAVAVLCAAIAVGCASGPLGSWGSDGPVPLYRRAGHWDPEDLQRDVIRCTDAARADTQAAYARGALGRAAARGALRDRTTRCMTRAGWSPKTEDSP